MWKKLFILAAFVLMLVAVPTMGVLANDMLISPAPSNEKPTIHVSGTGKITTTPDKAVMSFSVVTIHSNSYTAQEQNAEKMNKVIDALVAYGIPRSDIKTSGYSIYPMYDSSEWKQQRITSYQVTNTITVETMRIDKAGAIIDVAVVNGANSVNQVYFTLSDAKADSLRADALRQAVARARADADAVAGATGLTIDSIEDITVGGAYYPSYSSYYRDAAAAAPTPILPGDVDITATVTITYGCH